jgi:hypothetical protein
LKARPLPPSALQPGWSAKQADRSAEIQQRLSQGLQLFQGQRLDADGCGLAEGAAAAVELAKGDSGSLGGTATSLAYGYALLQPFLPASIQQDLDSAGVEQLAGAAQPSERGHEGRLLESLNVRMSARKPSQGCDQYR